jgi:mannose-1-phosphate guanylyltransferase
LWKPRAPPGGWRKAAGWWPFGIAATAPETGFGYIRRGEPIDGGGYVIDRFVEKPDLERAMAFLAEGTYAWNGGIFAFRAGDYLKELGTHRPAILAAVRKAVERGREDAHRFHPRPPPLPPCRANRWIMP